MTFVSHDDCSTCYSSCSIVAEKIFDSFLPLVAAAEAGAGKRKRSMIDIFLSGLSGSSLLV